MWLYKSVRVIDEDEEGAQRLAGATACTAGVSAISVYPRIRVKLRVREMQRLASIKPVADEGA